jgi:hypothetical protein
MEFGPGVNSFLAFAARSKEEASLLYTHTLHMVLVE